MASCCSSGEYAGSEAGDNMLGYKVKHKGRTMRGEIEMDEKMKYSLAKNPMVRLSRRGGACCHNIMTEEVARLDLESHQR